MMCPFGPARCSYKAEFGASLGLHSYIRKERSLLASMILHPVVQYEVVAYTAMKQGWCLWQLPAKTSLPSMIAARIDSRLMPRLMDVTEKPCCRCLAVVGVSLSGVGGCPQSLLFGTAPF